MIDCIKRDIERLRKSRIIGKHSLRPEYRIFMGKRGASEAHDRGSIGCITWWTDFDSNPRDVYSRRSQACQSNDIGSIGGVLDWMPSVDHTYGGVDIWGIRITELAQPLDQYCVVGR